MRLRQCVTTQGMVIQMSIRNDELMHYGIKGMKWGVRRYQNADGTLTKQGKARAKGLKTKQKLVKTYLDRDVSKNKLKLNNQLDKEDLVLEKGSKVTHITPLDFKQLRTGQDLYVSGTETDKNIYRAFLTMKMKSKGFSQPIKEVEFTLNKDLKAPSDDKQRKIFDDMYNKSFGQIRKDLNAYYKNNKTYKDSTDAYNDFIKALDKPSESKSAFFGKLKDSGYNAILDTHDITDTWIQAKKPLIVMDAVDMLGNLKVSEVTNDRLAASINYLMQR